VSVGVFAYLLYHFAFFADDTTAVTIIGQYLQHYLSYHAHTHTVHFTAKFTIPCSTALTTIKILTSVFHYVQINMFSTHQFWTTIRNKIILFTEKYHDFSKTQSKAAYMPKTA